MNEAKSEATVHLIARAYQFVSEERLFATLTKSRDQNYLRGL